MARAANSTLDFHDLAAAAQQVYRGQAQMARDAVKQGLPALGGPRVTWCCRPDPSKVPSPPPLTPTDMASSSAAFIVIFRFPAEVKGEGEKGSWDGTAGRRVSLLVKPAYLHILFLY